MAKTYPKKHKLDGCRVPKWDMIDECEALEPEHADDDGDDVSFCDQCGRWIPKTEELFFKKIIIEKKKGKMPENAITFTLCGECNSDWDDDI